MNLVWEGLDWEVIEADWANSSAQNVWIDGLGYLHTRVAKVGGVWKNGNVRVDDKSNTSSQNPFGSGPEWMGFGKYRFECQTPLNNIDRNLNAAYYLYPKWNPLKWPPQSTEIDLVEVCKWSDPNAQSAKTTIFPNVPDPLGDGKAHETDKPFNISYAGPTTHVGIRTATYFDYTLSRSDTGAVLFHWRYEPADPQIWLPQNKLLVWLGIGMFENMPPSNGQEQEFVTTDFEFTPAGEAELLGDLNKDGRVNVLDATILGQNWTG
jgi:hypothetical protein